MIQAVLFDLDGTLADTAPDLGGALNRVRVKRGLAPMPLELLRPHASAGARGLLGAGMGIKPGHPDFETLRDEFLDFYEANLKLDSTLFEGVNQLLDALEARDIAWGIVTNKIARFTDPLVGLLGLSDRAGCVISGDTTPHTKPHPAPLLEASRRIGVEPYTCIYVGDDERDIQAARAAGMKGIIAAYGYLGSDNPPAAWGADGSIDHPMDALRFLG